jgi:hypothetical protein
MAATVGTQTRRGRHTAEPQSEDAPATLCSDDCPLHGHASNDTWRSSEFLSAHFPFGSIEHSRTDPRATRKVLFSDSRPTTEWNPATRRRLSVPVSCRSQCTPETRCSSTSVRPPPAGSISTRAPKHLRSAGTLPPPGQGSSEAHGATARWNPSPRGRLDSRVSPNVEQPPPGTPNCSPNPRGTCATRSELVRRVLFLPVSAREVMRTPRALADAGNPCPSSIAHQPCDPRRLWFGEVFSSDARPSKGRSRHSDSGGRRDLSPRWVQHQLGIHSWDDSARDLPPTPIKTGHEIPKSSRWASGPHLSPDPAVEWEPWSAWFGESCSSSGPTCVQDPSTIWPGEDPALRRPPPPTSASQHRYGVRRSSSSPSSPD